MELNDAMIRTEGEAPLLLKTLPSSMSKNVDTASGQVSRLKHRAHERLKAEILQNELPLRVSYYIFMLSKQSTIFA